MTDITKLVQYLEQLNMWLTSFENKTPITTENEWNERKNKLMGVISFLEKFEISSITLAYLKDSLVRTDSLVRMLLKKKRCVVLSRLSTLIVEHFFSLIRSKYPHLIVHQYFQHAAHFAQIFLILHQENSNIPLPHQAETKFSGHSDHKTSVSFVNQVLRSNKIQKETRSKSNKMEKLTPEQELAKSKILSINARFMKKLTTR